MQGAAGRWKAIGFYLEEVEPTASFEYRSGVITVAAAGLLRGAVCKGEDRSRQTRKEAGCNNPSRETTLLAPELSRGGGWALEIFWRWNCQYLKAVLTDCVVR